MTSGKLHDSLFYLLSCGALRGGRGPGTRSMSTQQQQTDLGIEMYAGSIGDKERIATQLQLDWFSQVLEQDLSICNNCFSKREDTARHFRSCGGATVGGGSHEDGTADLFCTKCEAGTGKPSLHREYDHIVTEITPGLKSECAGTVGREWDEQSPLQKSGSTVSFSRLITHIGQRLEELNYEIDDWDELRLTAEGLKDDHPNRDRAIFARVFSEAVEKEYSANQFDTVSIGE